MTIHVVRHLFTVDEYYKMAQAGILHEDDRVELLEGEIVEMAPIGSRHAACVKRLNHIFSQSLGGRAIIGVQDPARLSERSEPQPDLTLLRPRPDFYSASHPGPEDVLLLIEVADTTEDYDREIKMPLYALSGIAEVWLVALVSGVIEVYRDPSPDGYREVQRVQREQHISVQAFPDVILVLDEVLG